MDRKELGILNILCLIFFMPLFLACATSEQEDDAPVGGSGFYYEKQDDGGAENFRQENEDGDENYEQENGYGGETGNEFDITNENTGDEFDDDLNFADVNNDQGGNNQGGENLYGGNNPYQSQTTQNPDELTSNDLAMNPDDESGESDMDDQVTVDETVDDGPRLWWIGYDLQKDENKLNIELITLGSPTFELNQEFNQSGQPELVISFQNTRLRKKLKRSLDTSEFLSPVAYVRTRYSESSNVSDVILTLRDQVKPELYSEDGNLLLTFAVPERYQGNFEITSESEGQAELLASTDITPLILDGSVNPGQSPVPVMAEPVQESYEEDVIPEETMGDEAEVPEDVPVENENVYGDSDEENTDNYGTENEMSDTKNQYDENNDYNENNNNSYDDNNNNNNDSNNENNNNENYNDENNENYNDENNENYNGWMIVRGDAQQKSDALFVIYMYK